MHCVHAVVTSVTSVIREQVIAKRVTVFAIRFETQWTNVSAPKHAKVNNNADQACVSRFI